MSTIVYQGLQSCVEPQVIETTTLKLKVASPSSDDTMEISKATTHVADRKGWSFFQTLSNNISSSPKEAKNEKESTPYVHPLTRTSPRLSQESLELCTENLGSETGSDTMVSNTLLLASSNSSSSRKSSPMESRSKANSRSFPPPLTTIRQPNPLQVRPHREDGRLIIKAIETPPRNTYLQAERSNGRLRLCFWKETATDFDSEMTNDQADIEDDQTIDYGYNESDINDDDDDDDEDSYQEDDDEQADDDDDDAYMSKDMEGNSLNAEVEMGMKKFQRPSRCNEGGHESKGLCDWKPLWVATS